MKTAGVEAEKATTEVAVMTGVKDMKNDVRKERYPETAANAMY